MSLERKPWLDYLTGKIKKARERGESMVKFPRKEFQGKGGTMAGLRDLLRGLPIHLVETEGSEIELHWR